MLTPSSTPNQIRSMPVEEEREQEDEDVDDDQEAELAARQARQQVLDPFVPVDAVEREAEHPGADQDEDDERRELRRRLHALRQEPQVQAPARDRHHERAGGAHRAAFGRRRDAEEDGAEHEEDQRERRDQDERHALGEPRQQAQLQQTVDDRDGERDADADRHADDEALVGGGLRPVDVEPELPERDGGRGREDRQHEERARPGRPVGLAQRARLRRERGHPFGLRDRDEQRVARVEGRQHDAGDERAGVHVADRAAELVGHDDQHERRRDDLRERARRRDRPRREAPVVAVAQHDRQRDEAHRDHARRHDAGGRGEQRADEDHRVGEAAAHRTEHLADRVEQVLGHAAALEDQSHEREERHREQRVVRHHAPQALGQGAEQRRMQQAELDADQAEHDAVRGERERHRVAQEQEDDERREHQRREVGGEEGAHAAVSGRARGWGAIARVTPARRRAS